MAKKKTVKSKSKKSVSKSASVVAAKPATKSEAKNMASHTGLDQNVAGALCYVLGLITGIIFLVVEPENKFIKFHAMQSILWSVAFFIIQTVLVVTIVGILLLPIVSLLALLSWLYLMWQAYQGNKFKLPIVGDMADNMSK